MKEILPTFRFSFLLLVFISRNFTAFSQTSNANLRIGPEQLQQSSSTTDITICNNQLPFEWNGDIFLSAGTYSVVLTAQDGSDSVAVLNLNVNNVETSISNVNICNNYLPYVWNGNSYSASGTYSVTLTTTSGCDSVPILSLTVNNVVSSNSVITVCNNELPFNWNGNSYAVPGTYSFTLTSAAGCDSIATLNLSVNPFSSSTTNASVCANLLPYNWNGVSYAVPGIYVDTLIAFNGCDSLATLNLSINTASNSTTALTVCNNNLPYVWNGNSYSASGTYVVSLPGTSGCDSIATLILSVRAVHTSLTTVTTCQSQLPYIWNGNSYSAPGLYNIALTGAAGCDSLPRLQLNVVPFLTSTTLATVCNTSLPYQWNGNAYTASGTYSVTLTSILGCDSIATLVLDVATVITTVSNVVICSTQLPYVWNGNTYYGPGTYTVILTGAGNCDSSATLNLIVQQVIPSTTNVAVCSNLLPFNWNGNTYPQTGEYSVVLTGSSGCDSVANLNLEIIPAGISTTDVYVCSSALPYLWNQNLFTETGLYSLTLPGYNGCDSVATLNLTVVPPLSSTTEASICTNQLPYNWNSNTYTLPGVYSVILNGTGGCDSIANLHLEISPFLSSTTNVSICLNQAPYEWNGTSYSATGVYPITLPGSSGCDSVATLNLTINSLITDTINIVICNNQLPYSWNENSYTAAGTYSFAAISSAGCDSLAILNLSISGAIASVTDITICNNQLPFNWNGNSCPLAGTYPVTLTTASGCDSLAILNLNVTEILTSTTNVTVCTSALPYSWNGNIYSQPGTYSITTTNANGCDSVPILSLTLQPVITDTVNNTVCASQLPYLWNGNSYTSTGSYSLSFTGTGGCDSIITLNLAVLPVDTVITSIAVCSNQLPYNWYGNDYLVTGTYIISLTGGSVCDSVAILNLQVENTASSADTVIICSTQMPYIWNGNLYSTSGLYAITLTGTSGCDSIATLNLTEIYADTTTTFITICNSQAPYNWNGNNYTSPGIYSISLSASNGCDSVAILNLSINDILTSLTTVTICTGQLPYYWNGLEYNAAGTYAITLPGSIGCDSIATLTLIVAENLSSDTSIIVCSSQLPYSWNDNIYSSAGTYPVTLISTGGCDSIVILNLYVSNVLVSNTNVIICNSQLPYVWNGNSYFSAGVYVVTLTSAFGCDSLATLYLVTDTLTTSTTNISICASQLPFTWNGNVYSESGTYQLTLTSGGGCDSIAVLNLTVITPLSDTTIASVCNTQLPYLWNGNSYSATGNYQVILSGSSGCDSIARLELTITDVLTSISNVTVCPSQLPYNWNGIAYTSAGTFAVTLTGSGGCDSVATLNLAVSSVLTSGTTINTCSTALPFLWNGNSYNTTGVYSVTLVSSGGCDSVATLNLNVGQVITTTSLVTICNNALPYQWSGSSYNSAGTYNLTLPGSSGCDSMLILILAVKPEPTSLTNKLICSNELPYLWNGQSFSAEGLYTVALVNASGCDSIAKLKLIVNPVKTTLVNAATCINELPYQWNGSTYSTAGSHTITLSTTAGCDSIVTLELIINPVNSSTTNISVCDNQLPFHWNGQSYISAGQHTVILNTAAGCDSIAKLNLTINPVKFSTTDFSICSSEVPYTWNGLEYSSSGTYTVLLTSSAGCDSTASLNLIVNPTPAMPVVVSPVLYCQYDITHPLTASITTPGSLLLWYTSSTGGIGSTLAPLPLSAIAGSTNYYVSQSDGPCEGARILITVTVNNKPDLGPDKKLQICFGQSANLETIFMTGSNSFAWTANQLPVSEPTIVNVAGNYQLTVESEYGCSDTASVTLGIQPPVIAYAGADDNAEYGAPYQLSGSGGVDYQWSPAGLLNNPFIANPLAVLSNDATFILMVKDDIGCRAFDTVKLRVLKGPTFYVPTAFTPDGDGLNDIFRPTAVGIASLEYFRVFNRYGQAVFETSDLSKGWDGNYRGIKQNFGNYVWAVKGVDRTGAVKIMKGNVVLIR